MPGLIYTVLYLLSSDNIPTKGWWDDAISPDSLIANQQMQPVSHPVQHESTPIQPVAPAQTVSSPAQPVSSSAQPVSPTAQPVSPPPPGADLGGIKRGLGHGQIFEILICLSIETKKSV